MRTHLNTLLNVEHHKASIAPVWRGDKYIYKIYTYIYIYVLQNFNQMEITRASMYKTEQKTLQNKYKSTQSYDATIRAIN